MEVKLITALVSLRVRCNGRHNVLELTGRTYACLCHAQQESQNQDTRIILSADMRNNEPGPNDDDSTHILR